VVGLSFRIHHGGIRLRAEASAGTSGGTEESGKEGKEVAGIAAAAAVNSRNDLLWEAEGARISWRRALAAFSQIVVWQRVTLGNSIKPSPEGSLSHRLSAREPSLQERSEAPVAYR